MKTSYMFPTGTYNIILTREEVEELLGRGMVFMHCSRVPCRTGRAVWNKEEQTMVKIDEKDIFNDLRFMTECDVADMEAGLCNVQYVNIIFDEKHQEYHEKKSKEPDYANRRTTTDGNG